MILKFLIIGKQVYYASSKVGLDQDESLKLIDIQMPIQVFWESEKLLQKADFLIASAEDSTDVREVYKKFFKVVAPYAIDEKEKFWLYDRAK